MKKVLLVLLLLFGVGFMSVSFTESPEEAAYYAELEAGADLEVVEAPNVWESVCKRRGNVEPAFGNTLWYDVQVNNNGLIRVLISCIDSTYIRYIDECDAIEYCNMNGNTGSWPGAQGDID